MYNNKIITNKTKLYDKNADIAPVFLLIINNIKRSYKVHNGNIIKQVN